jgi:hypothetical protein
MKKMHRVWRGNLLLAAALIMVLSGCAKPRPWYSITVKNDSGSRLDTIVLTCDAFSCEFDNVAAGSVSEPTVCRNVLPETGQMLIVKPGGAKPEWQTIQLKSKVGADVRSAAIEFVINKDGTITLNSTPRPMPAE